MARLKKIKPSIEVPVIIPTSIAEVKEVIEFKPIVGKWIINAKKKILAGKIREIRKDETILWEDAAKTLVESKIETFANESYQCVELEPEMLRWSIL